MRGYRVQECIGKGAFGTVYLAETEGGQIKKRVAIKVLNPELRNPKLLTRLKDEAHMLASLQYRSIVTVDDFVELNGTPSIVMEFVEGCDLRTLIKHQAIPPRVALQIAEEVALALQIAWNDLKLIHRDIKPENVRITPRGEVKLLDFGVAKADFSSREARTTQTGFGTLAYMASERLGGEDRHESDIYSLGIMLFEMVIGKMPGKHSMDENRRYPGKTNAEDWHQIKLLGLLPVLTPMLALQAEQRPSARECASQFRELATQYPGINLAEWASQIVPQMPKYERLQDDRLGTLLFPGKKPQRSGWLWGVAGMTGLGTVALCAGVSAAIGAYFLWPAPEQAASPTPAPAVVSSVVPETTPAPEVFRPAETPTAVRPGTKPGLIKPVLTGKITVLGARGALVDGGALTSLSPGTYTVAIRFSGGGQLEQVGVPVETGKTTTINCNADYMSCTTGKPW